MQADFATQSNMSYVKRCPLYTTGNIYNPFQASLICNLNNQKDKFTCKQGSNYVNNCIQGTGSITHCDVDCKSNIITCLTCDTLFCSLSLSNSETYVCQCLISIPITGYYLLAFIVLQSGEHIFMKQESIGLEIKCCYTLVSTN